jgi:thiamine-phosphate pyrophosphorylase
MDKACELYLRLRADALPAASELATMVAELTPAALLVTGVAGAGREALLSFLDDARRLTVAVLIESDAGLARELGAEGVHMHSGSTAVAEARRLIGDEKSLGVSCTLSRHDAMTMAELGADYIAFGEIGDPAPGGEPQTLVDMIRWWDELFEVPCVAWLHGTETDDEVRRLIEAGADYLAVGTRGDDPRLDLGYLQTIAAMAGGDHPARSA